MAFLHSITITDKSITLADAAMVGKAITVAVNVDPLFVQESGTGTPWVPVQQANFQLSTDNQGAFSLALPCPSSCDAAIVPTFTLTLANGDQWAGIVPENPGGVYSIHDLKAAGWSIVQGSQTQTFIVAGMTWQSAYSTSVTYNKQDVVTSGGVAYVSKSAGNLNHTPPNATYWDVWPGGSGGGSTPVATTTVSGTVTVDNASAGNPVAVTRAGYLASVVNLTDANVAVANKDGTAATPSLRTLGTGAQQAAAGNDTRLSNTRVPTPHAGTHLPLGSDALDWNGTINLSGTDSGKPAASAANAGLVYWATDTNKAFKSNGTTWTVVLTGGSSGGGNAPQGQYLVSSYADLPSAITAVGAADATLVLDTNASISTTVTIPATLNLEIRGSGFLTIATGGQLVINGQFNTAPTNYIFSSALATPVLFGNGATDAVHVEWFNSISTSDDSLAFTQALNSLPSQGGKIVIASSLTVKNAIVINRLLTIVEFVGDGSISWSGTIPGAMVTNIAVSNVSTAYTLTVTTNTSHNLTAGQWIYISGATGGQNCMGLYTVASVLSATQFTVTFVNASATITAPTGYTECLVTVPLISQQASKCAIYNPVLFGSVSYDGTAARGLGGASQAWGIGLLICAQAYDAGGAALASIHDIDVFNSQIYNLQHGVNFGIAGGHSTGDCNLFGGTVHNCVIGIRSEGFTNRSYGSRVYICYVLVDCTGDRNSQKFEAYGLTGNEWGLCAIRVRNGEGCIFENIWLEHTSASYTAADIIVIGSNLQTTNQPLDVRFSGTTKLTCNTEQTAFHIINSRGLVVDNLCMSTNGSPPTTAVVQVDSTCTGTNNVFNRINHYPGSGSKNTYTATGGTGSIYPTILKNLSTTVGVISIQEQPDAEGTIAGTTIGGQAAPMEGATYTLFKETRNGATTYYAKDATGHIVAQGTDNSGSGSTPLAGMPTANTYGGSLTTVSGTPAATSATALTQLTLTALTGLPTAYPYDLILEPGTTTAEVVKVVGPVPLTSPTTVNVLGGQVLAIDRGDGTTAPGTAGTTHAAGCVVGRYCVSGLKAVMAALVPSLTTASAAYSTAQDAHLHFTGGRFHFMDVPSGLEPWGCNEDMAPLTRVGGLTVSGEGISKTIYSNYTNQPWISSTGGGTTDPSPLWWTGLDRLTLRDLTVEHCGQAKTTSNALNFDETCNSIIERVRVFRAKGRGIALDGGYLQRPSQNNIIRDCQIFGRPPAPRLVVGTGSGAASATYSYCITDTCSDLLAVPDENQSVLLTGWSWATNVLTLTFNTAPASLATGAVFTLGGFGTVGLNGQYTVTGGNGTTTVTAALTTAPSVTSLSALSVTTFALASGTVTATVASTTGLQAGQYISITGAGAYNGFYPIASVPNGTTFTFTYSGAAGSSTGTAMPGYLVGPDETQPSDVMSIANSGKPIAVFLEKGPYTCIARNVYRYDATTAAWKKVHTVSDNTTPVYTDATAQGGGTAAAFTTKSLISDSGIEAQGSTGNTIESNIVDGVGDTVNGLNPYGIHITYKAGNAGNWMSDQNRVIGNMVRAIGSHGIRIFASNQAIIQGNHVSNAGTAAVKAQALRIDTTGAYTANKNIVSGNQFWDDQTTTSPSGGSTMSQAVTVVATNTPSDNSLISNTSYGGSGTSWSIAGTRTIIRDNNITGNGSSACITLATGASGTSISGNYLSGGSATRIASITNDASPTIRGNVGYNPVGGSVTQPAVPATTVPLTNTSGVDCMVIVAGGTVTGISVGGTATGLTSGTFRVPANQTITLTYSVAPTTFVWIGD